MNFTLIAMVAFVGAFLALQAVANARLGDVGQNPLTGAVANFVVGLVLLVTVVASGVLGRPKLSALGQAPWWAWVGGAIGATFITTMIIAVPRIGAVTAFAAIILGQLVGSAVIDTFGLLGMPAVTMTPMRLTGLALVAGGAFMTQGA